MSAVFPAQFPGRCHACNEPVEVGAYVTYTDDELVHARCVDAAPTVTRGESLCPDCYCWHTGGCA